MLELALFGEDKFGADDDRIDTALVPRLRGIRAIFMVFLLAHIAVVWYIFARRVCNANWR